VRRLMLLGSALVVLFATGFLTAAEKKDTAKAAETRKKLKQKIDVDFSNERLEEVMEELRSKIKGVGVHIDFKGGVSRNLTIKYEAKGKPVEKILDEMFKKNGLGYYVRSQAGAYDGDLFVRQGKERGYPAGDEPKEPVVKTKEKGKEKTTKTKAKEKAIEKKKADKDEPADAEKIEQDAARKFGLAKSLAKAGKVDRAKERLSEIIDRFPSTKAAESAKELLKELGK
jgi:hypothetical protein